MGLSMLREQATGLTQAGASRDTELAPTPGRRE
jgi:hypothetical protein